MSSPMCQRESGQTDFPVNENKTLQRPRAIFENLWGLFKLCWVFLAVGGSQKILWDQGGGCMYNLMGWVGDIFLIDILNFDEGGLGGFKLGKMI